MGIDSALKPLFNTSVSVAKRTSSHTDGYPKPGFASPTAYSAHIEKAETLFRDDQGKEVVSKRKIFIYSDSIWTSSNVPRVEDKITLPGTHPPINPQIFMVDPVSDENGIHHIVIFC